MSGGRALGRQTAADQGSLSGTQLGSGLSGALGLRNWQDSLGTAWCKKSLTGEYKTYS